MNLIITPLISIIIFTHNVRRLRISSVIRHSSERPKLVPIVSLDSSCRGYKVWDLEGGLLKWYCYRIGIQGLKMVYTCMVLYPTTPLALAATLRLCSGGFWL